MTKLPGQARQACSLLPVNRRSVRDELGALRETVAAIDFGPDIGVPIVGVEVVVSDDESAIAQCGDGRIILIIGPNLATDEKVTVGRAAIAVEDASPDIRLGEIGPKVMPCYDKPPVFENSYGRAILVAACRGVDGEFRSARRAIVIEDPPLDIGIGSRFRACLIDCHKATLRQRGQLRSELAPAVLPDDDLRA